MLVQLFFVCEFDLHTPDLWPKWNAMCTKLGIMTWVMTQVNCSLMHLVIALLTSYMCAACTSALRAFNSFERIQWQLSVLQIESGRTYIPTEITRVQHRVCSTHWQHALQHACCTRLQLCRLQHAPQHTVRQTWHVFSCLQCWDNTRVD